MIEAFHRFFIVPQCIVAVEQDDKFVSITFFVGGDSKTVSREYHSKNLATRQTHRILDSLGVDPEYDSRNAFKVAAREADDE